ncbi:adenylate/guanylate cyclase domain-containing protein [Mycobacterium sp. 852002-40037_SCH5390672]|uniref:adenylate/guanylate cyclase domain-containing protein n=1 Tax=Mycobacterium sp. 852002-40037_SCH5390672 TaxID=1834089 RepID=UPI0008052106|nr:adenylate/guanylate cyclase domain-containing protein [Mycobacterium sp. 852002-40037_SCH5390672]OBB89823.1 cyclase [Mycobacterium sp. 852002-40037_SCH5390672]
MTTSRVACPSCGAELRTTAKFCDECGSPAKASGTSAEYKQVTVLFADVVRSMDIAASVGPERLREIMGALVERAAAVVQRFGGRVDKFTGDGIMAVFGAPVALEDHAFRACMAALGIQDEAGQVASEVAARDEVDLRLRVGLNSGQVIAGEIGSGALGYTAIGEQVGMAQRMESVAPPGGVMLSESTARLVEDAVVLDEPEVVHTKGASAPLPAHRLIATTRDQRRRSDPRLVGRTWELNTIAGLLDEAIAGAGCVVGVLGPPGIGKSRIVREAAALANTRGADRFTTYCESHTSDIPFHAVTGLMRAGLGVDGLDGEAARTQLRLRFRDANPDDLLLLDDLLGVADPGHQVPQVEGDARRRRLTALVNSASMARATPVLYVIEDVHWIDDVSESMLADFMAVIRQTCSMVLITYRPEYRGALATIPGAQTIALRPLNGRQTEALLGELLGSDSSLQGLAEVISERAGGNPFFAEEIVRDLAERGAIDGARGAYRLRGNVGMPQIEATVPATLQAVIAARVDRISSAAKRTLNAAAVIGSRFNPELLSALGTEPVFDELVMGELIDQVGFGQRVEYAFRHPLIRAVAYESQLKSDRAALHQRLAAAIEQRGSVDESAALIAEHLNAAGDLHAAFDWYMRAGSCLTHRDITAARASWRHAQDVADRLPGTDPDRAASRIAARTLLCASAWLAGGSLADTGFDELRDLANDSGDKASLAMGMAGWLPALVVHSRFEEASQLASELISLLEAIGDPTLTLGLSYAALAAKLEHGEMTEVVQLAQRIIELADGDASKGDLIVGSPLVGAMMLGGCARCYLGDPGWRADVERATAMVRAFDPTTRAVMLLFKYTLIYNGVWLPDAAALKETEELLAIAERSGHNLTLACAQHAHGVALAAYDGPGREDSFTLLAAAREAALQERYTLVAATVVDAVEADEMARAGDLDGAIELSRAAVEQEYLCGDMIYLAGATAILVGALLHRGGPTDLQEAQATIDRLAAVPTEPGFVLHDIWLLRMRALEARAHGDDTYRDYRDRYRAMANSLDFQGHIAWAEEMA